MADWASTSLRKSVGINNATHPIKRSGAVLRLDAPVTVLRLPSSTSSEDSVTCLSKTLKINRATTKVPGESFVFASADSPASVNSRRWSCVSADR